VATSGLVVRSGVLRLGRAGVLPAPTALQTAVSVAEGREKELAAAHVTELAKVRRAHHALSRLDECRAPLRLDECHTLCLTSVTLCQDSTSVMPRQDLPRATLCHGFTSVVICHG
jgi:hypothetical protein